MTHKGDNIDLAKVSSESDPEIDLNKAMLFADSNRGVYIPQHFAQSVKREYVTGISAEDYSVLETGPEHEHYWDAWADVLDNATITDPKIGECYLHHDGDLWVVPVEKEEEQPETIKVLGITFRKMTPEDYEGFAGANAGCFVADTHNAVLIYDQAKGIISEFPEGPPADFQQRDWIMSIIS